MGLFCCICPIVCNLFLIILFNNKNKYIEVYIIILKHILVILPTPNGEI